MSFKTTATRLYNFALKILIEHVYITLFVGTIISLTVAYCTYSPSQEFMAGILALPGISALFAATFQLLKDHAAHQRKKEELQLGHNFTLGISSYMSQKVFDKHIEFCEKYMAEIDKVVRVLVMDGPHKKMMGEAQKFTQLRYQYQLWLTSHVHNELEKFEKELFGIGNYKDLADNLTPEDHQRRAEALEQAFQTHRDMLKGLFGDDTAPSDDAISILAVKDKIKKILEIDLLVKVRQESINMAIKQINKERRK